MASHGNVTRFRMARTKASNHVRQMIVWLVTEPAKTTDRHGLPSWWPFWADTLKANVIRLVRTARELEALENHEQVNVLVGPSESQARMLAAIDKHAGADGLAEWVDVYNTWDPQNVPPGLAGQAAQKVYEALERRGLVESNTAGTVRRKAVE